jgi:hypothetical protein
MVKTKENTTKPGAFCVFQKIRGTYKVDFPPLISKSLFSSGSLETSDTIPLHSRQGAVT